jgi:hypothetical protein
VLNEIYLLRLRAVLARARGDDRAHRDDRDRYRDIAASLGFDSTRVFEFCSRLVDLVVGVGRYGGGGHRFALAGERFVGLVAEAFAGVSRTIVVGFSDVAAKPAWHRVYGINRRSPQR